MPDLQSRLRRVPRELEPLYDHLLDMIEPEYLPWASKAFQVLRRAQQLSIEGDVFTFTDQAKRVGEEKEKAVEGTVTEDKVWHARSPGPHSKIHFLHRTAHDYLLQPSVWENLLSSWEWDISLGAIIHAHEAEKAILQVPAEVLEYLDRMMPSKKPAWMVGKTPWNRGWTQVQKLPEAKSFLPIAAMFGQRPKFSVRSEKPLAASLVVCKRSTSRLMAICTQYNV
ncbi:hypothetical protein M7I_3614 [Glarea lozoyensis 74030]|uniref:Uncharacterized protein n=1 Tax=Glarea lozoyensis (strain ATCC 74030 / MF5533) TaxID=1104152 RepID=H0ELY9_GLAL7|nr:hypothetical protein M7I_3614 [Glarea lozoyensis 74030]